jgi:PKD repeat protein
MQNNNTFRKILIFGIMTALVLSVIVPIINAGNFQTTNNTGNKIIENELLSTHCVLGEYYTTTTCPYCPTASAQMYQVYNMGYEFYYISLVGNMNSYAAGRGAELGFGSVPSVAFDGGYTKIVGMQSSVTVYQNAVINCGARTVANIDLDVDAFWLGSGQITVNAEVTNNGGSTYNGHLHVYVTEITSRWNDASGAPYHFAMINNYALNQNVQVSSSSSQIYSNTWSGYTDISMSNIKVIASVFSQSTMYTDETTATNPIIPNSDPPSTPSQPAGSSTGIVGIPNTYSTSSTEPNGDPIKYGWDWDGDGDVDEWTDYYSSGAAASTDHAWSSTGTYNIKVKAKDQFGTESGWSSAKSVNVGIGNPPNTPGAPTGETNGMHKTQYTYTASTTDPNAGDQIYYWFDWGDGTNSGWKGPYSLGSPGSATHAWDNAGSFDVKVKAKDLAGSETDWSPTLNVNMGNTAPNRPSKPSGPPEGIIGKDYTYSTSASDPEGDNLKYKFVWGDGTDSGWVVTKFATHSWSEVGHYEVAVKAKDDWDESTWSQPLDVDIFGGDLDVSAGGSYEGTTGIPISFTGTVEGGVEPYLWEWDFGDGENSSVQNPTHTYYTPGEYIVSLYVSDNQGSEGVGTTTATLGSNPPETPTITGETEGRAGEEQTFTVSTTDPDGDEVYYWIEWFEGCPGVEWQGSYSSGEDVAFNHTYDEQGEYTIRVKSKDIYDEESDWGTLVFTAPKTKIFNFRIIDLLRELISHFPILEKLLKF